MLGRAKEELDFKPTELFLPDNNLPFKYSVFRLDFSAVIIELQKAKNQYIGGKLCER